jgi:hypothetical protein
MSKRRGDSVAQAIARYAPNWRVADALGLGALMEGGTLGWGPFASGDHGQSHGPFQVYQVAHHDITVAESENPDYAVRYMLKSYEEAAAKVPESLWRSNPELASEKTAYLAERPLKDYYQTENVDAKWAQLQGKIPGLKRQPVGKLSGPGQLSSFGFGGGGSMSSSVLAIVVLVVLVLIIRK